MSERRDRDALEALQVELSALKARLSSEAPASATEAEAQLAREVEAAKGRWRDAVSARKDVERKLLETREGIATLTRTLEEETVQLEGMRNVKKYGADRIPWAGDTPPEGSD